MCPDTKYFTGGGQGAPDGNDELVLPAGCKEVQDAFTDFWVDFLWDPAAIGLAEDQGARPRPVSADKSSLSPGPRGAPTETPISAPRLFRHLCLNF